ncbi:MFS transporter [Oerskovia sp. NPDC060338]|uniref:MFS transporter n=1 Tax=Oerskovia sp. NPDC060338 TaxID=3347100 RepID=UPI00365E9D92
MTTCTTPTEPSTDAPPTSTASVSPAALATPAGPSTSAAPPAPRTTTLPDRTDAPADAPPSGTRFPLLPLLALAATGFVTLLTEVLPAGVLPALGADLGVSASAAGQTVTVFAIGAIVAAIPLSRATARWPRRRLLLTTIAGFVVANTVTAVSSSYALTLGARFAAGLVAGLTWALLAGYARRLAAPEQAGRALAIAMGGAPLALALGVPAGTALGATVGWRWAFGAMTILSLGLAAWVRWGVRDFPGEPRGTQVPIGRALRLPGVAPVVVVTGLTVLAYNVFSTYVAVFLEDVGLGAQTGVLLAVLGATSFASLVVIGALIDTHLRVMTVLAASLLGAAGLTLAVAADSPVAVYAAVAALGFAFGGSGTLFQTALARAAGPAADVAQSAFVTSWNGALALGGIVGGVVLGAGGSGALPWATLALAVPVVGIVLGARRHAFPGGTGGTGGVRPTEK